MSQIVALRGDAPKGQARFTPHAEGFTSSLDLIEALAETGKFTLRVGAYPDPHPEAADTLDDVRWLKRKFQAGADSAITQFFFETDTFLRFRDTCTREGIDATRIIPGIIPIENWTGIRKFASAAGSVIPVWMDEAFEKAAGEGRSDALAKEICTAMCEKLMQEGVEDLHFYTLNRPNLTRDVCHALGVQAAPALEAVA